MLDRRTGRYPGVSHTPAKGKEYEKERINHALAAVLAIVLLIVMVGSPSDAATSVVHDTAGDVGSSASYAAVPHEVMPLLITPYKTAKYTVERPLHLGAVIADAPTAI